MKFMSLTQFIIIAGHRIAKAKGHNIEHEEERVNVDKHTLALIVSCLRENVTTTTTTKGDRPHNDTEAFPNNRHP